jgi:hypothetical protein
VPVPKFHSEFELQGLTETRKAELKPFLTIFGTAMRAGSVNSSWLKGSTEGSVN